MREAAVALELEHLFRGKAEDFRFVTLEGLVLAFDYDSCRIANATASNRTRSSHSICVLKQYLPSIMPCSFSDAAAVVLFAPDWWLVVHFGSCLNHVAFRSARGALNCTAFATHGTCFRTQMLEES